MHGGKPARDLFQVRQIKAMCSERRLTQRQIGALFGVSQSTVMTIATGRAWRHVQ